MLPDPPDPAKRVHISINTTEEEFELIARLVGRAKWYARLRRKPYFDGFELHWDITTVHVNTCRLDLYGLLHADDKAFARDIFGIMANLDRRTGRLLNGFWPELRAPV